MNLQEAIITLKMHELGSLTETELKHLLEAIRFILNNIQLETKPGFVERREEQAWNIIEKMVDEHEESNDITLRSYGTLEYLKSICHPPTLK